MQNNSLCFVSSAFKCKARNAKNGECNLAGSPFTIRVGFKQQQVYQRTHNYTLNTHNTKQTIFQSEKLLDLSSLIHTYTHYMALIPCIQTHTHTLTSESGCADAKSHTHTHTDCM